MSDQRQPLTPEGIGIPGLEGAELVGRGGSAVVYKALQTSLRRTVAIKILTSSWDESVARRFDREQRAMGRLSNTPGIVPIYESGLTANGTPFIIMPFYAQGSLKDLTASAGPIPWERAAALILEVAEAVGHAHREGIVHRDLKPANILLSGSGRPLLADFGIARLTADAAGVETTAVTFTPAFCPPEVMDGVEPDPRADTYGLAATFWALVQGRPPFTDPHAVLAMDAVLKRVLTEPPPVLGGVPAPVAAFIERAMSKEPSERPADGHEFARQLRGAIAGVAPDNPTARGSEAETVAAVRRVPDEDLQERGRRPWVLPAAAAVVVCLTGVSVWAALGGGSPPAEEAGSSAADGGTRALVEPVVVSSGEAVQLLTLGTDADPAASLQTWRAATLAARDFGSVDGFEIEVLPPLEVLCGDAIDDEARGILLGTRALALVGSTCAESAVSVMEVAQERGISWISPDLRSPGLTASADGSVGEDHVDGFFRTAPNDRFHGTVAAQFAIEELGALSAVVVRGDGFGYAETAASFVEAFEATGDVTVIDLGGSEAIADVAAALGNVEADTWFWVLGADDALALGRAVDGAAAASVPRIAIEDALDESVARELVVSDTFVVLPLQPEGSATAESGRTLDELRSSYTEEFGEAPPDDFGLALAYDATILILDAIDSSAVVSGGDFTLDRDELRQTLGSAQAIGLTGPLACRPSGDCGSQSTAIVRVDGLSRESTVENVVKIFARAS